MATNRRFRLQRSFRSELMSDCSLSTVSRPPMGTLSLLFFYTSLKSIFFFLYLFSVIVSLSLSLSLCLYSLCWGSQVKHQAPLIPVFTRITIIPILIRDPPAPTHTHAPLPPARRSAIATRHRCSWPINSPDQKISLGWRANQQHQTLTTKCTLFYLFMDLFIYLYFIVFIYFILFIYSYSSREIKSRETFYTRTRETPGEQY